jgi:hypothetical protein
MGRGKTMRDFLGNCGCLILFILILPLLLIAVGPLLVLAALRGRQPAGPIELNTARYGPLGRVGALMLGLAVWILVWGGLIWVVMNGLLPASTQSTVTFVTPSPPVITATKVIVIGESTPASGTPIPAVPVAEPPTALPSNTPTDVAEESPATVLPVFTLPATETVTITETATFVSETATQTPESTETPTSNPVVAVTGTLTASLPLVDQEAVITVVEEGNVLLREAISLANPDNLQELELVWHDNALTKAQNFATDIYGRYAKPFEVQFEYIISPTLTVTTTNEVVVVSQEVWTYRGQTGTDRESFEFTYTLSKTDDRWFITRYGYLNIPTPAPKITPTLLAN